MVILIREAEKQDIDEMFEIRCLASELSLESYTERETKLMTEAKSEEHFEELLNKKGRINLVAIKCREVVGYLSFELERNWLWEIFVSPDYKGKGMGTKLLEELLARLEQKEIREVNVYSRLNSVGFYERNDFVSVGTHDWKIGDNKIELLLMRREF